MRFVDIRSVGASILLLFLVFSAIPGLAEESTETESAVALKQSSLDSAFDMGFDVIILRPAGVVGLVAGVGLFLPAVILTAPGGTEGVTDSVDIFLATPWRDLFERPLGDI